MSIRAPWLALIISTVAACGGGDPDVPTDAADDPASDAPADATIVTDASPDGAVDGGLDAAIDAPVADAPVADAPVADAALADAAVDAASDAPIDAPSTGRFRTVGGLAQPRLQHAAARLPDGRVLVVGGIVQASPGSSWTATADAEVFDPVTETFAPVAPMALPRSRPHATTLTDGRVLVTGAATVPGGRVPKTEIFDPATNTFVAGPDTLSVHTAHTATLLADGRVLVAGASVEAYVPATSSFQPLPPLNLLAPLHEATRLANGRVLHSGGPHQGSSGGGTRDDAEEFDPATSTFAITGDMATPRASHQLVTLPGGRALVTGGYIGLGGAVEIYETAEVYDPVTRTFASVGAMTTSRSSHTATPLVDGRVLVTGGSSDGMGTAPDNTFEVVASAELYDPAAPTAELYEP
ncbi:MAG: hypothetical protein K8M05_18110 [Deltaproteobacteria bacterium]|nr:hypothetical protein [Kofleriaceae bacterium]